jgi:cytochrome b6-f complex iron-sulfur subunit
MDTWLFVVIGVLVVLAGVAVAAAFRRNDTDSPTGTLTRETLSRDKQGRKTIAGIRRRTGREIERAAVLERKSAPTDLVKTGGAAPVAWSPPDAEAIGVSRRQFFNRSLVLLMSLSLATFGASIIAFLWPQQKGGFGAKIRVGPIPDIIADINANAGFLYVPEGKMWLTEFPAGALEKAEQVYTEAELPGMRAGVVALFQKCPHLGCRVPECVTSQWFECPCHGSRYNQVGEKRGGPAPRGMDHFGMSVDGDVLIVDTGNIVPGPAIGVNTTGQEPEGPSCLGASTH